MGTAVRIETVDGVIEFAPKHDLNAEESDPAYLPRFYDGHVVELRFLESRRPGGGRRMLEAFLTSPEATGARAIFLDCSPLFMDGKEVEVMQRLHDLYHRYGFKGKTATGYSRMWRFNVVPESVLSCFESGFNAENDLHSLLRLAIEKRTGNTIINQTTYQ